MVTVFAHQTPTIHKFPVLSLYIPFRYSPFKQRLHRLSIVKYKVLFIPTRVSTMGIPEAKHVQTRFGNHQSVSKHVIGALKKLGLFFFRLYFFCSAKHIYIYLDTWNRIGYTNLEKVWKHKYIQPSKKWAFVPKNM